MSTSFSPWVLTMALRALGGAARPMAANAAPSLFKAAAAPSGPRHKPGRAKRNHKKAIAWRQRRRNR